jgi:hypothetical protein
MPAGLAVLGWVRYQSKPGRTRVVWSGWVRIDDGGTGKLSFSAALSDPLLNLLEDVGDVEAKMVRRCRHHRDLCPALRELPLEDGQRQLRSDFGLPREDRNHPRFKARFRLPHEPLKGLVRFTTPAHPVRESLGLDARQFGRRLSIAPTTDGVQNNGRSMIRQLRLAAL